MKRKCATVKKVIMNLMGISLVFSLSTGIAGAASSEDLDEIVTESAEEEESTEEETEETISVGDTVTTDYYEFTLTSIGYADATVIPTTEQASLTSTTSENFLIPLSRSESDSFSEAGYEILSAVDGYDVLYFSFDYSFVGKEDTDFPEVFGANITLSYLDYTFSSSYYAAHRTVSSDGDADAWHSLTSTTGINRSVPFYNPESQHHPFEDYTMEARGFIAIPEEVAEDDSAVLTLSIDESFSQLHVKFQVDPKEFDNRLSDDNTDDEDETGESEISLETAMENFTKSDGQEYFINHMDEYTVLSGDEINQIIMSKSEWNIKEKHTNNNSAWSGKFDFENDGNIKETIYDGSTGYFNSRTWAIDGDDIILSSILTNGEAVSETCEMRLVTEGVYLLVSEKMPYVLMR